MKKNEVLKVTDLNVTFDHEQIIKNLSFSVHEKEVLVILGPNGGGKTTLLRALLNLIPYSGTITWYKKHLSYLPPQELIQRKSLPPLTVQEFFSFKKIHDQQIVPMLSEVGLDKLFLKKKIEHLSTGEFQRMLIAWTLVDKPEVLLFDEPASGIDIGGEETVYQLLHKLWKKQGITIILVTHDISLTWEHATNVLCINKQKLCYGRPEIILSSENLQKIYGAGVKLYEHRHG